MRIYNGKDSVVDVPLVNQQRLVVRPHSVSQNFMPSTDFLKMMATAFEDTELALIVSGAFEGNMCANVPAVQTLCVSSLDEALARFNPPVKPIEEKKVEPKKEEPKKEEPKKKVEEEVVPETPNLTEAIETAEEPVKEIEEEKPVEEAKPKKKQPSIRKKVIRKKKTE